MPLTDYLMHKMHFRCNKNWFKVGRRWFKIHLWHIFIQTFIQKWFRKKTMLVFLELQTGQKFLGPSVTLQNVQLLLGSTKCKRHYKLVQMFPMLRCLWPNTSVRYRWNTPFLTMFPLLQAEKFATNNIWSVVSQQQQREIEIYFLNFSQVLAVVLSPLGPPP